MDNVSVLEYSLMSDIYDEMTGSVASESFDYFDEYFGSFDGYDYEDANEAVIGKARVGKFMGFIRAVIKGIAAFFKKMGLFITTWARGKEETKRQIQATELNRILDLAAGRIKDCMVFVKKKTIVFAERVNKIKFFGPQGAPAVISDFEKFSEAFDPLIKGVEDRTEDVRGIQVKFSQDWSKTLAKSTEFKNNPTDHFKVADNVRDLGRESDARTNTLIAQRLRDKYRGECVGLGNAYLEVYESLQRVSKFDEYQQNKVSKIAGMSTSGLDNEQMARLASSRSDTNDDAAEFDLAQQSKEITEKTKTMESAVANFNRMVLLTDYGKEAFLQSGVQR